MLRSTLGITIYYVDSITITAARSIVASTTITDVALDVMGGVITLTATTGSVGTSLAPLRINQNSHASGLVSATACTLTGCYTTGTYAHGNIFLSSTTNIRTGTLRQ